MDVHAIAGRHPEPGFLISTQLRETYPKPSLSGCTATYQEFRLKERSHVGLLANGKDALRSICTHIRDHPHQGVTKVFCRGGKSRTGVVVAFILAVAGVERE